MLTVTNNLQNGIILMSTIENDPIRNVIEGLPKDRNGQIVLHLTRNIKLDQWENILFNNLPDVDYKAKVKQKEPYVVTIRDKGVELPNTYYVVKDQSKEYEGKIWEFWSRNKIGFRFSPKWKFPNWINENLKLLNHKPFKLITPHKDAIKNIIESYNTWKLSDEINLEFENFSNLKLDYLLAEYAGIIDRGLKYTGKDENGNLTLIEGFKIDQDSPIVENIKCYLRMIYGGESGLNKQVELWLDALDIKNQGLPSTLGRRNASFNNPEQEIRDAVFMGSVEDPNFANSDVLRRVFVVNGQTRRKYHEGTNRSKLKKVRIDTDPSDMNTCSDISRRDDKVKRKGRRVNNGFQGETTLPEGLAFWEEGEYIPTLEHLPLIKQQLVERYDELYGEVWNEELKSFVRWSDECIQVYKRHSGYYKTNIDENGKITHNFCEASKWNPHWDSVKKEMNEGLRKSLPKEDIKNWIFCSSEVRLIWCTYEEYDIIHNGQKIRVNGPKKNTLSFKGDSRRDPVATRSRILGTPRIKGDPQDYNPLVLSSMRVMKKDGSWTNPYSFKNLRGETISVLPKSEQFSMTTWNNIRRYISQLDTIEKLLHEERWETLAFIEEHNDPIENKAKEIFEEDEEIIREVEAEARIVSKIEEIILAVSSIDGIYEDTKEKFIKRAEQLKETVGEYIYGEREEVPTTFDNCNNNVCSVPAKRKPHIETPFDRQLLDSEWTLIRSYKERLNSKETKEEFKPLLNELKERAEKRLMGRLAPHQSLSVNTVVTEDKPKKKKKRNKWAFIAYLSYLVSNGNKKAKKRLDELLEEEREKTFRKKFGKAQTYNLVKKK